MFQPSVPSLTHCGISGCVLCHRLPWPLPISLHLCTLTNFLRSRMRSLLNQLTTISKCRGSFFSTSSDHPQEGWPSYSGVEIISRWFSIISTAPHWLAPLSKAQQEICSAVSPYMWTCRFLRISLKSLPNLW